jgi:predicted nucleic acid-binding protein
VTRIVVDASALAAVVFGEPEGHAVASRLDGAAVFAPALLQFELANTAWKKCRRQPKDAPRILAALTRALETPSIAWRDVDHADAVLVARATGLTAYDASYLWLAGALGAVLVTLDRRLARAGESLQ